jgi:hypothetical protein
MITTSFKAAINQLLYEFFVFIIDAGFHPKLKIAKGRSQDHGYASQSRRGLIERTLTLCIARVHQCPANVRSRNARTIFMLRGLGVTLVHGFDERATPFFS